MSSKLQLQDNNLDLNGVKTTLQSFPDLKEINAEVSEYTALLAEAQAALDGKAYAEAAIEGKYVWKKSTTDGTFVSYVVGDDLQEYPDGGNYDGYYWELASKIEFMIANTTYYAVEGMTWAEWAESEFNTLGVTIKRSSNVVSEEGVYVGEAIILTSSSVSVYSDEVIWANEEYQISSAGAGA